MIGEIPIIAKKQLSKHIPVLAEKNMYHAIAEMMVPRRNPPIAYPIPARILMLIFFLVLF
jgi:hypothetical protein